VSSARQKSLTRYPRRSIGRLLSVGVLMIASLKLGEAFIPHVSMGVCSDLIGISAHPDRTSLPRGGGQRFFGVAKEGIIQNASEPGARQCWLQRIEHFNNRPAGAPGMAAKSQTVAAQPP